MTLRQLFDGTDPNALCAGGTKPIYHEWYIFARDDLPQPAVGTSAGEPKRYLRVLCEACGADGTMAVPRSAITEWAQAENALDEPYLLLSNNWQRVKEIHQRRPGEWERLTQWGYTPPGMR